MPDNVSIEISNFVTKGCLSNREHAEEAPKICAAVDLTLSSGGHPPSIGGLLRSGRIAPRSCRASISSMLRNRGSSLRHLMDAAGVLTAIRSGPFGMAHTQKKRQSGMTFLRIVIPL